MKTRFVYQTVEDRDNPDEVERSGPFCCSKKDAWLGTGYYFWESFIDNAHWWGANTYPHGYIICQASYVNDEEKCLDFNTPEGVDVLKETMPILRKAGITPRNTYVSTVIEFLKKIGHFQWEAARITPRDDRNANDSPHRHRARVDDRYSISLCPAIQICFYSKTALQLSGYNIIFPNEYVEGYAV